MRIAETRARVGVVALAMLLASVHGLSAMEAVATLQGIDVEKRVVRVQMNGNERTVPLAKDVRVLGSDGDAVAEGILSKDLKPGTVITITADRTDMGPLVRELRIGAVGGARGIGHGGGRDARPPAGGKSSVGFKPLNEMGAADLYEGEAGGLYGGGSNEPPSSHLIAAKEQTASIVPLDAEGKPAQDGKIGLVSISMSNATQEYSLFKELADADPRKSARVAIVDCAQGGQAMAQWVSPTAPAWQEAERRLKQAGVSPQQVQVIWVKLANKGPSGNLSAHVSQLERDTIAVLQNAKARFPNLRIAYLGSRIYGGYAASGLNPEPYAYEGAFAVRWLIQDQITGDPALNFDQAKGVVKAPLALWGPYLWADGLTPRKSDGLQWKREDFGSDGTHPSSTGRRKVADMLLRFFTEDPLAATWFVKQSV